MSQKHEEPSEIFVDVASTSEAASPSALKCLIQERTALQDHLQTLEDQIYHFEGVYLEESKYGNIMEGWRRLAPKKGPLTSRLNAMAIPASEAKKRPICDEDRWFSKSSKTSPFSPPPKPVLPPIPSPSNNRKKVEMDKAVKTEDNKIRCSKSNVAVVEAASRVPVMPAMPMKTSPFIFAPKPVLPPIPSPSNNRKKIEMDKAMKTEDNKIRCSKSNVAVVEAAYRVPVMPAMQMKISPFIPAKKPVLPPIPSPSNNRKKVEMDKAMKTEDNKIRCSKSNVAVVEAAYRVPVMPAMQMKISPFIPAKKPVLPPIPSPSKNRKKVEIDKAVKKDRFKLRSSKSEMTMAQTASRVSAMSLKTSPFICSPKPVLPPVPSTSKNRKKVELDKAVKKENKYMLRSSKSEMTMAQNTFRIPAIPAMPLKKSPFIPAPKPVLPPIPSPSKNRRKVEIDKTVKKEYKYRLRSSKSEMTMAQTARR